MVRTLPAVYENGVLRPLQPLPLKEHEQVTITVSDSLSTAAEELLDHEYLASVDALDETEPTLEEVRRALSKIPGKLSDDVRAERDATDKAK